MFKTLKILLKKNNKLYRNLLILREFIKFIPHAKFFKIKCPKNIIKFEDGDKETFFGYYDKSPKNISGDYVLYYSSSVKTRMDPCIDRPIDLILYDVVKDCIVKRINIFAYNWQQGSKAQWIGDFEFIYNNYSKEEDEYYSESYNIKTQKYKKFKFPIYDVYKDFAFYINFSRLASLRPDYGYFNKKKECCNISNLNDDGIYYLDLIKNESHLWISIGDLLNMFPTELKSGNDNHKINHIMISPNGDKFVFLHRFFHKGKKYDRLFIAYVNTKEIKLINDHHMISHYGWYGNDCLIAYMRRFNEGDAYFHITLDSFKIEKISNNKLNSIGDGHPTCYNDIIITDTYPDHARFQKIVLYNVKTNEFNCIGEFFHSVFYDGTSRCDLHPKWSGNGEEIFFESVFSGKRHLYSLKL